MDEYYHQTVVPLSLGPAGILLSYRSLWFIFFIPALGSCCFQAAAASVELRTKLVNVQSLVAAKETDVFFSAVGKMKA